MLAVLTGSLATPLARSGRRRAPTDMPQSGVLKAARTVATFSFVQHAYLTMCTLAPCRAPST
jgi:hypothetical protein